MGPRQGRSHRVIVAFVVFDLNANCTNHGNYIFGNRDCYVSGCKLNYVHSKLQGHDNSLCDTTSARRRASKPFEQSCPWALAISRYPEEESNNSNTRSKPELQNTRSYLGRCGRHCSIDGALAKYSAPIQRLPRLINRASLLIGWIQNEAPRDCMLAI